MLPDIISNEDPAGIVAFLTMNTSFEAPSSASKNILTVTPASKGLITFYKRQLSVFLQHEKALSQREWEIKEKHERFNRRVSKEKMNEILDQLADLDDFDLPRDPKKLN